MVTMALSFTFVIDPAVSLFVGLRDHVLDLGLSEFLAHGGHDATELRDGKEAVLVLIEHPSDTQTEHGGMEWSASHDNSY